MDVEHRMFVYDSFVRSGESGTAVQCRKFRRRFNIHRSDSVPARDTVLRWVNNLRKKGSIMKTKPKGPQGTVCTPENTEKVKQAMYQSPAGRSARKHSAVLGISSRTVARIFHEELHFHPHELAMVQELNVNDCSQAPTTEFCTGNVCTLLAE